MTCPSGKKSYPTPQRARRALEAVAKRAGRKGLYQYRCPICRAFHLTHRHPDDQPSSE